METTEKVLRANPEYLTKTYVWLSAKSVCINRCHKKRIQTVDIRNPFESEEDTGPIPEHSILGDSHDFINDHYQYLLSCLGQEELVLLEELLEGTQYTDIASNLGVSLRTIERRVAELKWKTEFLLSEEDPDLCPMNY
jgi:DNA-directed RNA polymerase specialized sigma24 family protein